MSDIEGNMPSPSWTVTYALTREELTAFQRYYAKRRRAWLTYLGVGAGTFAISLSTMTKVAGVFVAPIMVISVANGILSVIVLAAIRLIAQRRIKTAASQVKVVIGDAMIVRIAKSVRHENILRTLHDIVRRKGVTYFFINQTQAIIVPDRAFKSPGEAEACMDYAIGCWMSRTGRDMKAIGASPFTITFALDDDSIMHRTYSRLGRKRSLKPAHFIELITHPIIALAAIAAGIFFLLNTRPIDWSRLIVFLYPIVVLARLYATYGRTAIIKRARRTETGEPQTFQVTPEGLEVSSSNGSSVIKWPAIKLIEEDEKAIYIDLASKKWFMIPKAAFLDQAHHRSFADAAKAYQEGRQPETPDLASWPPKPASHAY